MRSSDLEVPIDVMVKRAAGVTYVFAVSMRDAPTLGHFTVKGVPATPSRVEVVDEGRTLTMSGGRFRDEFAGDDVHIYKIVPARG